MSTNAFEQSSLDLVRVQNMQYDLQKQQSLCSNVAKYNAHRVEEEEIRIFPEQSEGVFRKTHLDSRGQNDIIFTRYLYEFHQVKCSLQFALLEKCREEALFWAYELYYSGFQEDVWNWVHDLYVEFYKEHNPKFNAYFEKLYLQWKTDNDSCLIGTIVGTLAMRDQDGNGNKEKFIILYAAPTCESGTNRKKDRHQTQEVKKPHTYLKQVSQFPIREEGIKLAKNKFCISSENVREAYLGQNWLYYCAKTPIWESRIREGGGISVDESKSIVFAMYSEREEEGIQGFKRSGRENESDNDFEAFYDKWGFEPDEQSAEMHKWHGCAKNVGHEQMCSAK